VKNALECVWQQPPPSARAQYEEHARVAATIGLTFT